MLEELEETTSWRILLPSEQSDGVSSAATRKMAAGDENKAPDAMGAVNHLEALFHKMHADLSYVSRKLDTEFSGRFAQLGAEKLNPRRLLQRLDNLRERIDALNDESDVVLDAKEDVMKKLQRQLAQNHGVIAALNTRVNLQVPEIPEELALLQEWAGEPLPSAAAAHPAHNDTKAPEQATAKHSGDSTASASATEAAQAERTQPVRRKQKKSPEFFPVTEEEFLSVSELVRGRVTLKAVNHVYKTLFDYFAKKKRSCEPLTVKDMTEMGLKITGQTGEAKLKVLRQLKLIVMNKQGVSMGRPY